MKWRRDKYSLCFRGHVVPAEDNRERIVMYCTNVMFSYLKSLNLRIYMCVYAYIYILFLIMYYVSVCIYVCLYIYIFFSIYVFVFYFYYILFHCIIKSVFIWCSFIKNWKLWRPTLAKYCGDHGAGCRVRRKGFWDSGISEKSGFGPALRGTCGVNHVWS